MTVPHDQEKKAHAFVFLYIYMQCLYCYNDFPIIGLVHIHKHTTLKAVKTDSRFLVRNKRDYVISYKTLSVRVLIATQLQIHGIETAMQTNIETIDWMDNVTRAQALLKLSLVRNMVGFPPHPE